MKILAWAAAVGSVAALVACGGGGGNTGGGGSGGTSPTSTVSSTSSSGSPTSSSSGTGGSGPACGITWESDPERAACETCMEDSCCSEMAGCAPGTKCDDLLACAQACGDNGTCVDTCITDNQQGYDDYNKMFDCYNGQCKNTADCIYQICDSTQGFSDQKCAECLGTNATCCMAVKDCAADNTCVACDTDPTAAGCDTNALYTAYSGCFDDTCGQTCTFRICGSDLGYSNAGCNYCLSQAGTAGCCTSYDACLADTGCKACLTGTGTNCNTNTLFTAFTTCRSTTCATACGG